MRYLRLFLRKTSISLSSSMQFRGNFILSIISGILEVIVAMLFFEILYFNGLYIEGWSYYGIIFLIGTSKLINTLYIMTLGGLQDIARQVERGTFDFYLVKPVSPLLNISIRGANLNDFFQLAISLFILFLAMANIQITYHLYGVLLYILLVIIGVYLRWIITFIISVSSFWVIRVYAFQSLFYDFLQIQGLPLKIFKGTIRFFFLWIFPILLIANLPVRAFLNYNVIIYLPSLISGVLVSGTISIYLWRKAIGKYTSTGS